MENLGSVIYRPDLNQVYLGSKKTIRFFEVFDPTTIQKFIQLILSGITPVKELEDIHLEAFLASQDRLRRFKEDFSRILGLVVYPKEGEIKQFRLNQETEFFSDIHQNPDPLTIRGLKYGLHIHPKKTDDYVWVDYNNQSVPNRITGGLLFKRNPIKNPRKYAGFSKFIELNPFKPNGCNG